jgi:hypothetical protein
MKDQFDCPSYEDNLSMNPPGRRGDAGLPSNESRPPKSRGAKSEGGREGEGK